MFGAFGRALEKSRDIRLAAPRSRIRHSGRSVCANGSSRCGHAELRKSDMIHNDASRNIEVDSETYEVRADGELLTCRAGQRVCR